MDKYSVKLMSRIENSILSLEKMPYRCPDGNEASGAWARLMRCFLSALLKHNGLISTSLL